MPDLLTTLISYVPALVVRRLAANPAPISAPVAENFPAAVLFADISGFTALAERLARRGAVGAEELTRLLNAYFGQLIALVAEHGGEVVKFAGDALLALWPAGDEPLETGTLRAAQCGLAMHHLPDDTGEEGAARLVLRIGIGAGEVTTVHLGGVYGRWEVVVSGTPLTQMSTAEHHAHPGDVLLSDEAWALICGHCVGQPLPEGAVRLERVAAPLPLRQASLPQLT